jgi:hypothetical protein
LGRIRRLTSDGSAAVGWTDQQYYSSHGDRRACHPATTPSTTDLRGLRFLADRLGDRFQFGVLLTAAPEATPFGPKMAALPVSSLWSSTMTSQG